MINLKLICCLSWTQVSRTSVSWSRDICHTFNGGPRRNRESSSTAPRRHPGAPHERYGKPHCKNIPWVRAGYGWRRRFTVRHRWMKATSSFNFNPQGRLEIGWAHIYIGRKGLCSEEENLRGSVFSVRVGRGENWGKGGEGSECFLLVAVFFFWFLVNTLLQTILTTCYWEYLMVVPSDCISYYLAGCQMSFQCFEGTFT